MAPRAPKPAGTAGRGRGGGFKRPSAADKAAVKASAKPRTQARPERQAAVKPGKHVTLAPSASGRKPALQRGPSESRSPTTKRLIDKVSDAEPPVQSFDLPYYSAGDATAGRGRGGGFKRPSAADKAVVKASAKPRTQARPERQAAVKPGKHVTLAPSASGRKPALQRGPSESRSPTTKRLIDKVSDAEPPVQSFDLPYYSAGDATAGRGRGGGFKRPSAADKAVVKASAKPRTQARPERQAAVKPGKHATLAPSASGNG